MAKIDKGQVFLNISQSPAASNQLRSAARQQAQNIFQERKIAFINEFIGHPVSQEISFKESSSNVSNTLNGKGNLWGFIGFEIGDEPIQEVVDILAENITLGEATRPRNARGQFIAIQGNQIIVQFPVFVPTREQLKNATPLPWESGRSWLFGIEQGISGFGSYLAKLGKGRSRAGIQAKKRNGQLQKLRSGRFRPIKYFSNMYNKFLRRFDDRP